MLERFLPRFNARFAVAASQREPAWRPLDPALDLGAILAFRHSPPSRATTPSSTTGRTLQLLPSAQRPSYAGARVEVLERPGGELAVRHQGETILSRLAPPRSGVLRERRSELALDPALERIASGLGSGGAPPGPPELPCHGERDGRQRHRAAGPGQAAAPAHPAAAGALEGHPPGTTQGLSMRAYRPRAGHLPRHRQCLPPRRRPPRRQGAASSTEQRPAREDIFAELLSGQSR